MLSSFIIEMVNYEKDIVKSLTFTNDFTVNNDFKMKNFNTMPII